VSDTFASVIEEWNNAVATWQPTNGDDQASFMAVRLLVDELPPLLSAIADGCGTLADKSVDSVLFKSGAEDLLREIANYVRQAVAPLEEVGAGIDAVHRDDLERIRETDPRAKALDWGANQDVA
jgi:hypothetical protein